MMNQLFPRRMELYVLGFGGYSVVFHWVKQGHHHQGGFFRTASGHVRWFQVLFGLVALVSALRSWFLRYTSYAAAVAERTDSLEAKKQEARRQHRKLKKADARFRTRHDQPCDPASITLKFPIIQRVPYAHGGFFGAAPYLLNDPKWTVILRTLMPRVYIDISRRAARASSPHQLILWAENNPVCAAYGVIHDLRKTGRLPNIEWDVFLHPILVDRLELSLDERTRYCQHQGLSVLSLPVDDACLTYDQRSTLDSYDSKIAAQTIDLVNNMLIAHGSLSQLVLEQTGFGKFYNFVSIKKTSPTLGGGFTARTWLQCFAEALLMGMDQNEHDSKMDSGLTSSTDSHDKTVEKFKRKIFRPTYWTEILARATSYKVRSVPPTSAAIQSNNKTASQPSTANPSTNSPPFPFTSRPSTLTESLSIVRRVTGCSNALGIVFDLKSRHVSQRVWARVVDAMRQAGLRVEGIGSFNVSEITNLSRFTMQPVREVVFFHSAGDLQEACNMGLIKMGASVFFNAGSLIAEPQGFGETLWSGYSSRKFKDEYKLLPFAECKSRKEDDGVENSTVNKVKVTSTLEDYKNRYGLHIGLYCQEFATDHDALKIIVDYVNCNQHIVDLGLSWGGFNGTTTRGIKPTWWEPSDGMWKQRYAGTPWDTNQFPPISKDNGALKNE